MADSIDLTRISKGDHRVKLSRVFRDPSINTHGANNPKFEIWIAFEYENNHLVNAEVLKTAAAVAIWPLFIAISVA